MECLAALAVLVAVGIAIGGSIRLRSLGDTLARLTQQNARLEARVAALEARAAEAPPLSPAAAPEAPPEPVAVPAAVPEPSPGVPPVTVEVPAAPALEAQVPTAPAPPPPLPGPTANLPPPLGGLGERLRSLSTQREPARPAASLEERLGAHLPVWIGSIALALAGAFLVKYSFDQGLLSPAVRVALGVAFGVALLAGGEWMRRSSPGISQGLSAAGIADLFACFLAGVHLYHLIPPAVGFTFMALTALVAVLLSLRQGVMVALIGLAGGFLTPALIRADEPDVRNLFAYLLVLVVAVAAVSRQRGWNWVTGLAIAGGLVWVLVWLSGPFQAGDAPWLSLFLLATAVAALVSDLGRRRAAPPVAGVSGIWLSSGTLVAALGMLAIVTGASGYSTTEWLFLGLLAASTLVLSRLHPSYDGLAWVAAAAPALLLALWGFDLQDPDMGRFLWIVAAFGALFAAGAYAASYGTPRPGRWASLSAVSAVVYFLLSWATTVDHVHVSWGALALGLAVLYLLAALPVARRRREAPEASETNTALAALAVAVTVFVSLAVPLELERQWLTVAWAVEVTALTWLAGRFRLPVLTTLARLLALAVAVRLLLNPEVFNYPIGEHPVFNWLLYGYGIPLLAFAAAAWLARRQGRERPALELEWAAMAFGFALSTLLVRQWFNPGEPGRVDTSFAEVGTLAVVWLLLGLGLLAANRVPRLSSLETGGGLFLVAGMLMAFFGPGLFQNPLWTHEEVGAFPVVNLLLWGFGVPVALLGLAARELGRRESRLPAHLVTVGLVLAFLLVSLEVRQAFHGTFLDTGITSAAERYSYSAAWVAFGILLLVVGTAVKGKALRYASLAVMMLAVGKVFLYDTANLADLYRVFSFLGLGASLLLLAWVYQRFVFGESR